MDEHMKELNNEVFMCPDCELYHNSIEELQDHMLAHQFEQGSEESESDSNSNLDNTDQDVQVSREELMGALNKLFGNI